MVQRFKETGHPVNQLSIYGAVWTIPKYSFWYLFRKSLLETVCKKTFWASKHCPTKFSSQSFVKTSGLNIVYQLGWCLKLDQTRTTAMGNLLRIHTFSSEPSIPSLCSNSWGNCCWTSSWSSNRENSWTCNSIASQSWNDILRSDYQRNESICGWSSRPQSRTQTQHRMTLYTSRRERILRGRV